MHLTDEIAQRVVKAIARPHWKSADPTLAAMLVERNADRNRSVVRFGMWAAALSYIAYGLFDYFLFPDVAHQLITVRTTLALAFLMAIEFGVRQRLSLVTLHLIAASAIVVGALAWLLFALGTDHQLGLSYFMVFGTVFILGANLFFNFRLWLSAATSATVAVAFIVSATYLDIGPEHRFVLAAFFTNWLVLSLYLSWRLGLERYQTFLRALRGQIQEQAAIEKGQKLTEAANTDPLTGLKNRRAIAREFSEICKKWTGTGEIGVLLIDVDYFKRFNDRLGHQAGDECLVRIARALAETAALNNAIAGRYGGEEFVILCKVGGQAQLNKITRQFCQAVEELQIVHPDRADKLSIVTVSAGASLTKADKSLELRTLLQEADRALYTSKFAGRATFTIYDPHAVEEHRSGNNVADLLTRAVSEDLVSVVYQSIYDAKSRRILGHETLMRLRDTDGSTINPAVFIPVAERTGAIMDLGAWVIEKACRDMVEYELGAVVAVNVSAVQLRAPNFPLCISEILGRYGLMPQKLALEVTEGSDVFREAQAVRNIEQLRHLGVQIWLDDFGTGFAGLASLRRFSFDIVKIDRSFLHDCQSEKGVAMLEDIVRLLRNSGHTVLIEGVETEAQLALLYRLNIDLIQGFLLGRPLPIHEIIKPRGRISRLGIRPASPVFDPARIAKTATS